MYVENAKPEREYCTTEKEFYESIPNTQTRKEYRNGLQRFSQWFKKTPDEILQMRREDLKSQVTFDRKRFEREIEKFHAYLKAPKPQGEGAATNSARTLCLGIRQFFRYYEVPILLRRGSEVGKSVLTDKTYPLTIDDLRKMFAVADLKQRVMLSMAKDLALRIGDFVRIRREDLPDLTQEPPIPFDMVTEKEEVLAKGHLSSETVELLKTYLPTVKDKPNPYLFPSNGKSYLDEDTFGWNLKELARKAGIAIPKGKRLTFHVFRKLFISTGKNLNVDPDTIKALCGKKVDADILTYMTTVQWREAFSKIADQLKIQILLTKNHARLEELEEQNKKLQEQVGMLWQVLDSTMKALEEKSETRKAKMDEIRKIVMRQRAIGTKLKSKETEPTDTIP
jgi:integrase